MSFSKAQTTDISFLSSLNDKYKFYFSGEFHSYTNYASRYQLLTKLYATNNVRVLVLETFKEYEFDFNRFILTEDTDTYFLRSFHKGLMMNKPQEFDAYLKKIKQFNSGIKDSSQKISIICADINPSLSYAMLQFSFIYHDGYTENKELIKYIKKAARIGLWSTEARNTKRKRKVIYKLKQLLDTNQKDWRDLYTNYFNDAKRAVNGLYRNACAYEQSKVISDSARERIIYENILEAYNYAPNVSYYGNFGQMHTLLNCNPSTVFQYDIAITNSMANMLNTTPALKNKVCSMPYYYLDMPKVSPRGNKIFEKDFLLDEEWVKYRDELGKAPLLYVPINKLQRSDELNNMFNCLIISE